MAVGEHVQSVPTTGKTRPQPSTNLEQRRSRWTKSSEPDVWWWEPTEMPLAAISLAAGFLAGREDKAGVQGRRDVVELRAPTSDGSVPACLSEAAPALLGFGFRSLSPQFHSPMANPKAIFYKKGALVKEPCCLPLPNPFQRHSRQTDVSNKPWASLG